MIGMARSAHYSSLSQTSRESFKMSGEYGKSSVPDRPRVVLVDDDALFRESLGLNLEEEGYEVLAFASGQEALDHLLNEPAPDPILLDWRMPGLDGLAVLRRLREAQRPNPVIFLTMLSDDIYEEAALKWGAVDFIDKSRRLSIILQRLSLITVAGKGQTQQDAAPQAEAGEVEQVLTVNHGRFGDLELRDDINRAFWKGTQLDLTLTEYAIVRLLVTRAGRDVTYRDIYDLVHGKDFVAGYGSDGYKANVRSFIKRIRKKFRDVDESFALIDNYPGFGYRWQPQQ
ncbi:response regulator transcription factor [Kiloniella sp. b19]|uniref:response regulator transcription factor n=1 Tax=Kiloniella sp. GXU_MW_B19 TaxID=3141326 RepID=UPI0031E21BC8